MYTYKLRNQQGSQNNWNCKNYFKALIIAIREIKIPIQFLESFFFNMPLFFSYGKSYGRTADDCMANFSERQRELRRKADFNKSYVRSRSAPKMETIHSRDEIRRDLSRFREINKYKGELFTKPSIKHIVQLYLSINISTYLL